MSTIERNLQAIRESIAVAARTAQREVMLLAVSKTFGPEAVIEAVKAGQRAFGENYVQEAIDKIAAISQVLAVDQPGPILEWHFIGPIQSNKTRLIAENFDWVHSVGREKIAQRLSQQRPQHMPPLNVCLQVNISGEASKGGIGVTGIAALAQAVARMPHLRLRGLMAIPEPGEGFEQQCAPFRKMREIFDLLRAQGLGLDTLSMGMSADLEAAIAEGATLVRVGSAIFGKRD